MTNTFRKPRHQGEPLDAAPVVPDGSAGVAAGVCTYTKTQVWQILQDLGNELWLEHLRSEAAGQPDQSHGYLWAHHMVRDRQDRLDEDEA